MKRKVLFLIESLSGGGAEKVLSTIVQLLDKDRFEVTVCPIVDCGVHAQAVKSHADHYLPLLPDPEKLSFLRKLKYQLLYRLIYKLLPLSWVYRIWIPKKHDVEIAFVEGFVTKLLAHSSNKHSKKIAWVHIDLEQFHWTSRIYNNIEEERRAYAHYDIVAGVSKHVTRIAVLMFPSIKQSITLYNPIDADHIIQQSRESSPLPLKTVQFRLISTGRLVEQKGYDRLIRIMNRLIQDGFSVELYILGEGEKRQELVSEIERLNLQAHIHLLGFKSNPHAYLKQCDAFVCSSIAEGFSTAATEALIVGLPVITTNVSGMEELLESEKYGVITENTESALYEGLRSYLLSEERQKDLAKQAATFASLHTDHMKMHQIEEVLGL